MTALLVLLAAGLLTAGPASAAPTTMGLEELQSELGGGPLDGYMRTTLSGTTPTDVPVTIPAVIDGFYWGKLIMFESTDPVIAGIGGIASGMSGSPMYLEAAGPVDPMIGAVSHGNTFTLRGTGLATPIEYMTALQARAGDQTPLRRAASVRLDEPVATSPPSWSGETANGRGRACPAPAVPVRQPC
jgi:hypothetical protein